MAAKRLGTKGAVYQRKVTVKVMKKDQPAKHDRLVEVVGAIRELKAERAEKTSEYSKQIKELDKEEKALLDTISNGEEDIELDVYDQPDYQRGEMTVRAASAGHGFKKGDELKEFARPLNGDERDMDLDFGGEDEEEGDEEEEEDED